jgi:membrane protease YdiL (CAAX protease family)
MTDERSQPPPWAPWTAPAAIAVGLAAGLCLDVVLGLIARANGSSLAHPTPAISLLADLLFDLSFVGAALYFAAGRGRPRAGDFGYVVPRVGHALKWLVGGAVAYYVITFVYGAVFSLHGRDKLPSELGIHHSTAALIGAAAFVCVVAPMAEEFFFRGFLFGALRRWRGPWPAAILTSVLFGVVHASSAAAQYLVPLGIFGLVLCLIRWRTGSLYPGMALHSFNNSLALSVNDLHWGAALVAALMVGALALIAFLTLPLARSRAAKTPSTV